MTGETRHRPQPLTPASFLCAARSSENSVKPRPARGVPTSARSKVYHVDTPRSEGRPRTTPKGETLSHPSLNGTSQRGPMSSYSESKAPRLPGTLFLDFEDPSSNLKTKVVNSRQVGPL